MATKKTSNPREENVLIWPDFQKCFSGATHVIDSMYAYKFEFERIIEEKKRDYSCPKWVDAVIRRFKKNIEEAKKNEDTEKAELFSELIKNWSPSKNVILVEELYKKSLELLNEYIFAYQDIYERQRCRSQAKEKQESVVTPYFKNFPEKISEALNMELTYMTRLKSWYSFIQKLITRAESMNHDELKTFYDIYGCKFVVSNCVPSLGEDGKLLDYDTSESDCYRVANQVVYTLTRMGAEPLVSRNVGPVSDQIQEEYKMFFKDYIRNPKKNGYKALHIAFKLVVGKKKEIVFEVQIQSKRMSLNSKTKADHKIYKKSSKIELVFEPEKILLSDFMAESVENRLEIEDTGGLIEPKELTKKKTYYRS